MKWPILTRAFCVAVVAVLCSAQTNDKPPGGGNHGKATNVKIDPSKVPDWVKNLPTTPALPPVKFARIYVVWESSTTTVGWADAPQRRGNYVDVEVPIKGWTICRPLFRVTNKIGDAGVDLWQNGNTLMEPPYDKGIERGTYKITYAVVVKGDGSWMNQTHSTVTLSDVGAVIMPPEPPKVAQEPGARGRRAGPDEWEAEWQRLCNLKPDRSGNWLNTKTNCGFQRS